MAIITMSENENEGNGGNGGQLTPETAFQKYEKEGYSYRELGDEFDVSHTTARNKVEAYKEGRETGIQEAKENPKEYGIDEVLKDEEPDHNPFATTCPHCNEPIPTPDNPGENPCPNCNVTLNWSEDEI